MRIISASSVALALLLGVSAPHAADSKEEARRNAVVAKVGPRIITAGELEDKLAQVPRFQLNDFGASAEDIRRKFLVDILVKDALLAQGALDQHLANELPVETRLDRALSSATLRKIRADVGDPTQITTPEMRAYYDENHVRFESPQRVLVHRILCKTKQEAASVIEEFKKDPTPRTFILLARAHTQDQASIMRGGNLGFLAIDGSSNEAGVKVDPSVVAAAMSVKDGELVQTPVPEGEMFGVVWRKGTIPASHRPFEEVSSQIRETLFKEKIETAKKAKIEELRGKYVSEVNEPLLRTIDVSRSDGAITPRKRPGQVAPLGAPIPDSTH